jgi:hypothetical protein
LAALSLKIIVLRLGSALGTATLWLSFTIRQGDAPNLPDRGYFMARYISMVKIFPIGHFY